MLVLCNLLECSKRGVLKEKEGQQMKKERKKGVCRSEFDWSQQGPQCGAIDKGGRAGTCWSQALGGNKIVPSHLEGGSIALVKINLEKMCPCQRLC